MDHPIAKTLLSISTYMLGGCLIDVDKRVYAILDSLATDKSWYLLNVSSHLLRYYNVMPFAIGKSHA